ncbi:MAG: hypothetical protein DRP74_01715 [Candidatus Omnitrophota bacterium]|nr:MAG: hypothetical protein DRP74_01715 [Candidatus Omnitrophota bacterium]
MEGEMALDFLLQNIAIFASIIGILFGIDLIFGAKFMKLLKQLLEKSLNLDHVIIEANPRIIIGVVFLVLSLLIIFLIKKA